MKPTGRILVVDDNHGIRQTMELLLPMYFGEVQTLPSPIQLPSAIQQFKPHVVLLDMNFTDSLNSGNEGLFWAAEIRRLSPNTEVVLFTAYADIQLAVEGMKRGAFDFIVKPWENAHLRQVLTAARDKAMEQADRRAVVSTKETETMLWSTSRAMQTIRRTIERVATTDATILITGENGTGKDLLAREIHRLSTRRNKDMVAVDVGAITDSLFESEMFGHVKGAFTDAHSDHVGKFEQADKSTLFLDEIGNIPLHNQAKLLRALQNRTITRVGDTIPRSVDIRLIAATNAEIETLVRNGQFREDLYYRINTICLHLPPLRERKEDIEPLAYMFAEQFAAKYHRAVSGLSKEAIDVLQSNTWRGNIRELKNCIEKAVILAESDMLTANDVRQGEQDNSLLAADDGSLMPTTNLQDIRTRDEKTLILQALRQHNGNISAAASALGISRPTLYAKIKKYGIG